MLKITYLKGMFASEIVGNDVRFGLAAPVVANDLAHQLHLITVALFTQSITLDIGLISRL